MKKNKRIILLIGMVFVFCTSILAISQELSAEGKKNLRSANMHLGGKRHEKALPLYEKVLEENPNNIEALNNTAAIYYDIIGDYAKAREYFVRLIDVINATYAEYEELMKTDEKAAKKYEKINIKKPKLEDKLKAVIKFRDNCFTQMINQGKLKIQTQEYEEAIESLLRVTKVVPDSTLTYRLIALCYDKLDDKENSKKYFIKTSELDPNDTYAKQQVASLYFAEENFEEAGNWYLAATINEKDNPDNYYNAGIAYKNANKNQLAFDAFLQALELDPENLTTLVTLSNLALTLKDNEASTLFLQKAVDLDVADGTLDNPMYVTTLCYKLYGISQFKDLITYAEMWRQFDETSVEAVQMLYNAAKELNDKKLMEKYNKIYQKMQE
ncbi:MAG: tetratricopeptide repeat protein [Candidatus Cloacimonetes bacterium]|nr:tetratricopeptide repeat protein [Candidatus Cloacimonadota bacterium]